MALCWRMFIIGGVLVACCGRLVAQSTPPSGVGSGTIYGRFIAAYIGRGFPGVSVYVFTLAQSRQPRKIDEDGYRRAREPGVDEPHAETVQLETLDAISDLLPKLPRMATTKTGAKGDYLFKNVPAGRRYYIAALEVAEDGVFFAAKVTPLLRNGEKLRIDLRDNADWDERFKIK